MEPLKRVPQIVLIEDNPADALLFKIALEENRISHYLTEFRSGLDALNQLGAIAQKNVFFPDVILMDLHTPQCEGFEVLSKLREYFPQVPIAVVSSSRARADKDQAEQGGALYLVKPSDLEVFISSVGQAVKQMLNGTPLL